MQKFDSFKKILKCTLLYDLISKIKFHLFCIKIYRLFPHNDIKPMNIFPIDILSMGKYSYGELNIVTFNNKTKLKIGNFVSIAQEVKFLLDVEHNLKYLSTFPFKVKVLKNVEYESFSKGDIIIEDDVWIGYGAIILSGVHIGKGAVIAAGSIVTKDVPAYSVVGGIPAKNIKYRFPDNVITQLTLLNYSNFDFDYISNNISNLYLEIVNDNYVELIKELVG